MFSRLHDVQAEENYFSYYLQLTDSAVKISSRANRVLRRGESAAASAENFIVRGDAHKTEYNTQHQLYQRAE
jgi:hypothetical protein